MIKKYLKKGMAYVLTAALLAGYAPAVQLPQTVKAEAKANEDQKVSDKTIAGMSVSAMKNPSPSNNSDWKGSSNRDTNSNANRAPSFHADGDTNSSPEPDTGSNTNHGCRLGTAVERKL